MGAPGLVNEHHHRRVLVVDDDLGVREMLVRVFIDDGFEAAAAADGDEAVNRVVHEHFDVVLLDLGMPGQDGWSTLVKLRRGRPDLPVILITARPNQHAAARVAGAQALFEKPLDFPELLQTVDHLLSTSARSPKP